MEEAKTVDLKMIRFLRVTAILEGISYLLFGITVPLKYIYDIHGPNYVVGMAHGLLFILYIAAVVLSAWRFKWSFKNTFLSGLVSLIPVGTFVMDHRFFRHEARRLK